jgi:hypothetical protein
LDTANRTCNLHLYRLEMGCAMNDLVKFLNDMADDAMGMEPEDRLILGECAKRITALENALELILPMAKGYAAQTDLGNNQEMVVSAEIILKQEQSDVHKT